VECSQALDSVPPSPRALLPVAASGIRQGAAGRYYPAAYPGVLAVGSGQARTGPAGGLLQLLSGSLTASLVLAAAGPTAKPGPLAPTLVFPWPSWPQGETTRVDDQGLSGSYVPVGRGTSFCQPPRGGRGGRAVREPSITPASGPRGRAPDQVRTLPDAAPPRTYGAAGRDAHDRLRPRPGRPGDDGPHLLLPLIRFTRRALD
jgi:hypothetical protein